MLRATQPGNLAFAIQRLHHRAHLVSVPSMMLSKRAQMAALRRASRPTASKIAPAAALGRRFASETPITGPVIGIDLGTTNSCVSVMEGAHTLRLSAVR